MNVVEKLIKIVGSNWLITDNEKMLDYLADETALDIRPKAASELVLVKPANSREVSSILKFANHEMIPVFPRGGGTGLCGGAVPTERGIILSLERMDSIEIDKDNMMATVGAGVAEGALMDKAEQEGLFFPPHPGDESAQVGGLVACNAGGSRAVKYGVMRNYVKGIEAVLPTGDVLKLGGKLLKNNTGYNLMQLLIGSEGTLAVITEATLRLYAKTAASATIIIPFNKRHDAIDVVPVLLQSGIIPLAIEYMDRPMVEISAKHLSMEWPCKIGEAYLMIIVDGQSKDETYSQCESISRICQRHRGLEPVIGITKKEQGRVLKIRSNIYLALKRDLADALDIVVPPTSMGKLMDAVDAIATRYDTYIPMYGHAGDGNIHPMLMRELITRGGETFKKVRREIYCEAAQLGGVMTGEHGIGKIRTPDVDMFLDKAQIELMRGIKKVFDPNGILNPGCSVVK